MLKINELFEVISKHHKDHGVSPDKIRLRKYLYDELEEEILLWSKGKVDLKQERKELSKYGPVCSFFSGIRIETMNIDDSFFPDDTELIAVVNDRYVYSRTSDSENAKWRIVDIGPSLFSNKFPWNGSPFDDKYWNP